jgi:hypothetical protein
MRLLLSFLLLIALAFAPHAQAQTPAFHPELRSLYEADQADRQGSDIDWKQVDARDRGRRARVAELAASGALRDSRDFLHAAMVYQHGEGADDIRQAMQWALRAAELEPANKSARWLACAAEDRWLQRSGKPQVWGTQYMLPKPGAKWTQEPFDRKAKTDAERVAMNVPTLAESGASLEQMNAELNKK